jgi:serine/threonine protein phosphatase 1
MLGASSDYEFSYAVGDIHGRLDLLDLALEAIERHAQGRDCRVVFLGDYIDRGPDSRGVLERLIGLQRDIGAICLKGNHEDMMVRAFTDARPSDFARWRACGSRATLQSYGAGEDDDPMDAVPRDHIRWVAALPLTTADPNRIYVHAGLMPRTRFREQKEGTFLWIREAFLRAQPGDFETHIVHAHTPLWDGKRDPSQPELLAHRTNLDTAAFATGVLSVGVFDRLTPGGPVEVLSVRGEPSAHPLTDILGPREPTARAKPSRKPMWGGGRAR